MRSSLDFPATSQLFVFIIRSMFWTCIGVGILMLLNSSSSSSSSFSSYLWKSLHQKRPWTANISSQKSLLWILCFRFWFTSILLHEIITKSFQIPVTQLITEVYGSSKIQSFLLLLLLLLPGKCTICLMPHTIPPFLCLLHTHQEILCAETPFKLVNSHR